MAVRLHRHARAWPLTRKECGARKVPHQLRRVIPERYGNSMICDLCGATIEKARKLPQARATAA
jgi:RNA polymerase-binding transcription factor DksA